MISSKMAASNLSIYVKSLFSLKRLHFQGVEGGGRGAGRHLFQDVFLHSENSSTLKRYTVNPLYTDARYNDKIRYNDNLNVTKHSLKR